MKQIEIYTLDYCPYCAKAKMFLDDKKVKYTEISCEDDEKNWREKLKEKFNLSELPTFPQIIIDGVNIGGYSDMLDKYETGNLEF